MPNNLGMRHLAERTIRQGETRECIRSAFKLPPVCLYDYLGRPVYVPRPKIGQTIIVRRPKRYEHT